MGSNKSLWISGERSNFERFEIPNQCEIVIIGGGFSGLWSAFHLKKSNPSLDISIFEAKEIGFGASGRNGGWASSDYPVYRSTLIKRHGASKTELLFDSLHQAIDEIGEFAT